MDVLASAHIIIVDDDELFSESIQQNLMDYGYRTSVFSDGSSVLEYLADGGGGDLLLLDWQMPGMNGIEVLRNLRGTECNMSVIFLTVLSDQIYEEAGLLGGAVDFIEKSRSFSILLKRLQLTLEGTRANSPRREAEPSTPTKLGNLELQPDSSRAFWKGEPVDLTLTEFKIVQLLASRPGRDIRYRGLYDAVHGVGFVAGEGDDGYRTNVRTLIKRTRQKFRSLDEGFDQIENYAGFGYRWRTSNHDAR